MVSGTDGKISLASHVRFGRGHGSPLSPQVARDTPNRSESKFVSGGPLEKLSFYNSALHDQRFCPSRAAANLTTSLSMSAHWDDGTNIQGTVTFSKQNASGPDTVVVTQTLSNGRANLSEALGATTLYDVMLVDTVDTQLIKFPIATAMINPGNLKQAQINLFFAKPTIR
jgi:hypothetical protein